MADTIMYDLEVLQAKEAQLSRLGQDLSEVRRTLRQINSMVDDFWEGEASSTFKEKNLKTIEKVKEIKEDVDKAKNSLTQAVNAYRDNEETNKGVVGDLSTDNIF